MLIHSKGQLPSVVFKLEIIKIHDYTNYPIWWERANSARGKLVKMILDFFTLWELVPPIDLRSFVHPGSIHWNTIHMNIIY